MKSPEHSEWDQALKRSDNRVSSESSNAFLTCGQSWKQANHPCVHDSVKRRTALVPQKTLRASQTHDLYSSLSPRQNRVRKHEVTWRHLSWQTQRHRHERTHARRTMRACTDPHWPQMAPIIPDVGGCQDRWTAICNEEHIGTLRSQSFLIFFKAG